MVDRLNSILIPIVQAIEWVLFVFLFLLVMLTFTQVVLRYVFNSYLFWGDEVIFFLFTWLIFLSAALGMARGSHFSVDLIVGMLPARVGKWCAALVQLVVARTLGVFITVGLGFALRAWAQESDILRLPMTWMYLALPGASCFMLLIVFRNLIAVLGGTPVRGKLEEG